MKLVITKPSQFYIQPNTILEILETLGFPTHNETPVVYRKDKYFSSQDYFNEVEVVFSDGDNLPEKTKFQSELELVVDIAALPFWLRDPSTETLVSVLVKRNKYGQEGFYTWFPVKKFKGALFNKPILAVPGPKNTALEDATILSSSAYAVLPSDTSGPVEFNTILIATKQSIVGLTFSQLPAWTHPACKVCYVPVPLHVQRTGYRSLSLTKQNLCAAYVQAIVPVVGYDKILHAVTGITIHDTGVLQIHSNNDWSENWTNAQVFPFMQMGEVDLPTNVLNDIKQKTSLIFETFSSLVTTEDYIKQILKGKS